MDINGLYFREFRKLRINAIKHFCSFFGRLYLFAAGIKFGKNLIFYGHPYFFRTPNSTIIIGNNVAFRSDKTSNLIGVSKKCIVSTLQKGASIQIGDNIGFSGVTIGAAKKITIGSNVLVGANSLITDTNWHNILPDKRRTDDSEPKEVIIEDNVFIGFGSIILKGVRIGKNSVIGAGSVVIFDIPENTIAAGNPCKPIRAF